MSVPLWALAGFAGWATLLAFVLVSWRGLSVLRGERRLHEFPSGQQHGSDRYWRLNRAHLNALENLPLALVATWLVTANGVAAAPWVERLALTALAARLVQSLMHVGWNTPLSVAVRFTGFFTQLVCWAAMGVYALTR